MHCNLRGGGGGGGSSFLVYFSVSFVFGYLTWPRCWDPFFIFTIVMFRGGGGGWSTSHTPMISFYYGFFLFISHYSVS
jgi:hypothetical protein